jgi:hypothetical protein
MPNFATREDSEIVADAIRLFIIAHPQTNLESSTARKMLASYIVSYLEYSQPD